MDFITQSLMAAGGVPLQGAWHSENSAGRFGLVKFNSAYFHAGYPNNDYIYACGANDLRESVIAKYDLNGSVIWSRTITYNYIGLKIEANAITTSGSGIYFVSNTTNGNNSVVHKYDFNGNKIFENLLQPGGGNKITLTSISLCSTYFVCAGYAQNSTLGSFDIVVVKYDLDGNQIWKKLYGTSFADYCYDICIDQGNKSHIYFCGSTVYSSKTNALIVKIDDSGAVLWSNASLHSANGPDVFNSIHVATNAYATVGYAVGKTYNTSTSKNEGLISLIDGAGITATRRKIVHSDGIVLNGITINAIGLSHPSYYAKISGYIDSTPNKGFVGEYNTTLFYRGGKSFTSSVGTDFKFNKISTTIGYQNYSIAGTNGSNSILLGMNTQVTDGISAQWGNATMAVPTITDSTAAATITTGLVSTTAASLSETNLTTSTVYEYPITTSSCFNYSNKV